MCRTPLNADLEIAKPGESQAFQDRYGLLGIDPVGGPTRFPQHIPLSTAAGMPSAAQSGAFARQSHWCPYTPGPRPGVRLASEARRHEGMGERAIYGLVDCLLSVAGPNVQNSYTSRSIVL